MTPENYFACTDCRSMFHGKRGMMKQKCPACGNKDNRNGRKWFRRVD